MLADEWVKGHIFTGLAGRKKLHWSARTLLIGVWFLGVEQINTIKRMHLQLK